MSKQPESDNADGACTARRRVLSACVLVLALLPGLAAAKESTRFGPTRPPTMNFSVSADGTIHGQQQLTLTVTHQDKPDSLLVGCDKLGTITVSASNANVSRTAGWLDFSRHMLCNFTKKMKYVPFSQDNIRAACIGNPSHMIRQRLRVDLGNGDRTVFMVPYGDISAHVSCPATQAASPAPGNIHPVNACNFSGYWALWQTSPGREASVPFVLVANQGRSDVYQVSAPNNAGVSGSAVVSGYNVSISMQGPRAVAQSVSGTLSRSCTTLNALSVRSDAPLSLRATRRGGVSRAPAGSNQTRSMPNRSRSQPARRTTTAPRVPARVAPNWNTQLR